MIEVGLNAEIETIVTDNDTAAFYGSGLVNVLSTPRIVSLLEGAAVEAIKNNLASGETSVGTLINIEHIAPTPVGMKVWASAKLIRVDGRRLIFEVLARDEVEQVARGTHERFIVNFDRFIKKAEKKKSF
ncbi:thioesterase superfamily protein [Thermodesulfobium narugense DSM 14796]|uniref:Thioesterase superfamily protein n=1 Tax=Thermodesulfobium narugense DSM 14796 TaxID=747365 RepID=M1E923_9BACT|nr:thioesterase family protein [Thermodesulfobium narugense]AEE15285.1 thioesterase superfamily protein [Thermodesulfobium narugense DSM 14796]